MSAEETSRGAPPLLVIVGPTASGKTALAVRVARQVDGEIVSADSVQVYRGFDVGSGKPSAEERADARHHLVDVVDPDQAMDAADFARRADAAVADIRARGRVPIVCGGTFLWVRALLRGLAAAPPGDAAIRARHRAEAEAHGRHALWARLAELDGPTAARLSPNDLVRVSRALEVHELTGVPMSAWQAAHGFRHERYRSRLVGLRFTADELTPRIDRRVRRMLADGWLDEVRALLSAGHAEARAMAAVGYRQVAAAAALPTPPTADALADEIVRATRIFARRQRTWLRDAPVRWLTPQEAETVSYAELMSDSDGG